MAWRAEWQHGLWARRAGGKAGSAGAARSLIGLGLTLIP